VAIDRETVLQTAQKYAEKKKYDRAIIEYQKIIQVDPSDARTLLKMGDLQVKMGAYADAIATYERVGRHYVALGFFVKAVWVYKQIGEILTKHVPHLEQHYAHIGPKLAELYQNLGLTSDALATLDEVATRLQRQHRDDEAIEVFRKTIELDPNNPIPHLRLAEALSRARDPEGAASVFSTAASLLIRRGRPDDALKVLERLLHHKQDPAQARIAAELYLQRESPSDGLQALAKLQICFQANPKDLDTLALLARAFVLIGQATKGIEVHKEMARIARDSGKTDLFRRLVEELSELAPDDEQVRQLAMSLPARDSEAHPRRDGREGREEEEDGFDEDSPLHAPIARASAPVIEAVEIEDEFLDDDAVMEGSAPAGFASIQATDDDYPEMVVEEAEEIIPAANEQAIAELLEEAASLRRQRMYTSAAESLRIGLELDPHALELRHALRDVLIEAGRIDDAVDELFATASIQLDRLDGDGAAGSLREVLAIDVGNERALHMLHELGYDAPPSAYPQLPVSPLAHDARPSPVPVPPVSQPSSSARPVPDMRGTLLDELDDLDQPEPPLPAYELDELGTGDIMGPHSSTAETLPRGHIPKMPPPRGPSLLAIDDPFGSSELPLPEFPLGEGAPQDLLAENMHEAPPGGEHWLAAVQAPETENDLLTARQSVRPIVELEDALEEADFFASRGLYADARAVLREQLSRNPNNPLLHERIQELEQQEQGATAQTSGTRAVPNSVDERGFDISASLDALENLEEVTGPIDIASLGQVDVEEVFAKFKEGVGKQIEVDDADMHYDLGIAYKEIGKLDDAVRELQLAAQDGNRACVCESMIGSIHMDRGEVAHAIDAFQRGLEAPVRTPEQETMLSFELGNAYEHRNLLRDALVSYQRVARWNPNYRDVEERIRRLSRHESARTPSRPLAVGAEDDEFDRAFDEIIGDGKLP